MQTYAKSFRQSVRKKKFFQSTLTSKKLKYEKKV